MQNIENINYASDSGSEAIKKLDRNQRKIKDHLDTINVDGMQQQINNCLKFLGVATKLTDVNASGYYLLSNADNTIPVKYGNLISLLDGVQKTIIAFGWDANTNIALYVCAYNANTGTWNWQQFSSVNQVLSISSAINI